MQAGLAWLTAFGFAILSAVAGVALWTSQEKHRTSETMAELKAVETSSLRAAIETESLIAAQSLQRLRQVAGGHAVSALATLRSSPPSRQDAEILGFWSDEFATGFLLLPIDGGVADLDHIRVFVLTADDSTPFRLTSFRGNTARVIGLTQPANRLPPDQLMLEITHDDPTIPVARFVAEWQR